MHLNGGFSLKSYLQEIGITKLFNNRQSDLSIMSTVSTPGRSQRDLRYKVESDIRSEKYQLRLKDFVLNKRITKTNPGKKYRIKRDTNSYDSIKKLDILRKETNLKNPGWFADDVLHKVDLTINERGTEGGAATGLFFI